MAIERLTVRQLIALLQQYPDNLPVVVQSYEAGYDPVTDVQMLPVAETLDREWYVGVYDDADPPGEIALLISSKYTRAYSGATGQPNS
jgi:hypothetical protein